jgi:hypothetical protein
MPDAMTDCYGANTWISAGWPLRLGEATNSRSSGADHTAKIAVAGRIALHGGHPVLRVMEAH